MPVLGWLDVDVDVDADADDKDSTTRRTILFIRLHTPLIHHIPTDISRRSPHPPSHPMTNTPKSQS
jgi:hypothetical protein